MVKNRQTTKRIIIASGIVLILGVATFVVGLNLNVRSVHRDALAAEKSIAEMSAELDKFRSEFDHLARRVAVYQALSDGAKEKLSGLEVWQIADVIISYCIRYRSIGLMPSVILALWKQESNFNPLAVSYADAFGLGQLLWPTALPYLYDMGHGPRPDKRLLFNPVINAEVSIRHLVRLRQYYLSIGISGWAWPLSEYFWGRGNIWKMLWYAHQVKSKQAAYQEKGVM